MFTSSYVPTHGAVSLASASFSTNAKFQTMPRCCTTWFSTLAILCHLIITPRSKQQLALGTAVTLCVEPSPALEQFVEPLTFPPTIDASSVNEQRKVNITLGAFRITQKLHQDLPSTTLYAYGESQATATYPGPTILARRGVGLNVRWENHIPDQRHFLEIDDAIQWASPKGGGVPVVAHLHGGEVESASDGHPEAWFTPGCEPETGPAFVTQNYSYPNEQAPAALWYHDHTIGITRVNIMAGLSGMYVIRGRTEEEELGLPVGILLFIKDWRFFANGSLNFRTHGASAGEAGWCPEYGDTMLVNGKIWPVLRVSAGRVYRFRLFNGCNARFLNLSIASYNKPDNIGSSSNGFTFLQIGTDGGLLPEARPRWWLLTSPGERVDFLLNLTSVMNGTELLLSNSAQSPFPYADDAYFSIGTASIMKLVVVTDGGTTEGLVGASWELPERLIPEEDWLVEEGAEVVVRRFNLTREGPVGGKPPANRINYERWDGNGMSVVGQTEVWEIVNVSEDAHNMQVHLVQFRMLSQQSFDMQAYEDGACSIDAEYSVEGSCLTEERARGPEAYQEGWKDTLIMWPSNITRVLLRFAPRDGLPFSFDATLPPGYVWNSATPDHEDFEMRRRLRLISNTTSACA